MPITDRYLDLDDNVWKWHGHADLTRGGGSDPSPNPPTSVAVGSPTQTSLTVTWTPATTTGITEVRLYRSNSATGVFAKVATIVGNTTTTYTDPGLTAGVQYFYKMTSYNVTLNLASAFSTPTVNGTTTNPPPPPGVPNPITGGTAVKRSAAPTTDITVSWTAPAVDGSHAAATGYKIYGDGVLDNTTPVTGTTYTMVWDTPGDIVTVAVRSTNATGDGPLVTIGDVDLDDPVVPTGEYTMIMGTSRSGETAADYHQHNYLPYHGGVADDPKCEAVRIYRNQVSEWTTAMDIFPNAKVFGVTNSGLETGSLASGQNNYTNTLEAFYYDTNGNPRTGRRSPTTGIAIHLANGNEYGNNITSGNFAAWQTYHRGMYAATRTTNPGGGRRYPLAEMWIDPTTGQEDNGSLAVSVQRSLESIADALDGVAWSFYPWGRDHPTANEPTYQFPVPADPTVASTAAQRTSQEGWMERCFYRTQVTAQSVSSTKRLRIACWEVGTGSGIHGSPAYDIDARPWYVTHIFAQWMYERAKFYDRIQTMPVCIYWDNEKNGNGNPQDILSDENQATLTYSLSRPHTGWAWMHWKELVPHFGGTRPSTWPANAAALDAKGWAGLNGSANNYKLTY